VAGTLGVAVGFRDKVGYFTAAELAGSKMDIGGNIGVFADAQQVSGWAKRSIE
jgi:hypothetical protein